MSTGKRPCKFEGGTLDGQTIGVPDWCNVEYRHVFEDRVPVPNAFGSRTKKTVTERYLINGNDRFLFVGIMEDP